MKTSEEIKRQLQIILKQSKRVMATAREDVAFNIAGPIMYRLGDNFIEVVITEKVGNGR